MKIEDKEEVLKEIFDSARDRLKEVIILGWDKETRDFYSDTNINSPECMLMLEMAKQIVLEGSKR